MGLETISREQVFEQKLDWFYLQEGEYVPLPVDEDGKLL